MPPVSNLSVLRDSPLTVTLNAFDISEARCTLPERIKSTTVAPLVGFGPVWDAFFMVNIKRRLMDGCDAVLEFKTCCCFALLLSSFFWMVSVLPVYFAPLKRKSPYLVWCTKAFLGGLLLCRHSLAFLLSLLNMLVIAYEVAPG